MCILFAHRDQKNVIREMLPVSCLSIKLYSVFREPSCRGSVSLSCADQRDGLVAQAHTDMQTDGTDTRVFTVVHFKDQLMIDLPHLFAH